MRYKLLVIFLSIFIVGCATTNPGQSRTEFDSTGNVMVETSPIMTSKDYARMKSVQAAERSNQAFYAAESVKYSKLTDGRDVALVDAIGALSNKSRPTNYNDTLVADSAAKVEKHKAWVGFVKSVVNGSVVGYGIGKVADLGKTAFDNAGTKINVDNGSTATGAIGEGNTYSQTNELGGIPLEASTYPTVALGPEPEAGTTAPTTAVCDLREARIDELLIDINADGLVCSDGTGGVSDNPTVAP